MKNFARIVCTLLLRLSLLLAVTAAVVYAIIGTPQLIKDTLKASGVYDNLVANVLDQNAKNTSGEDELPLNDPRVKQIVQQALPPQTLEKNANTVLDGIYNWLDGKTAEPSFTIDLSGTKEQLAEGISSYAIERIQSLPRCTKAPDPNADPFSLDCNPPGLDLAAQKAKLKDEILKNSDVFDDTTITADSLLKTGDGQKVSDSLAILPKLFTLIKLGPYIFGTLTLLFAGLVVWLDESVRKGFKRVGKIIFGNGTFLFSLTLIFGKLMPHFFPSMRINLSGGEIQQSLTQVIQTTQDKITDLLLVTGGILMIIGAIVLLLDKYWPQPKEIQPPETNPVPPIDDSASMPTQKSTEHTSEPEQKQ